MVPPVSGPLRDRQGRRRAGRQGSEDGTRNQGGVYQKDNEGCTTPPSIFPLAWFGFFVLDRMTEPRQRGGERRERPPLFDRWRGSASGGVYHPVYHRVSHPPRLRGGRSRLYVSLLEGSPARARAGRRTATSGAMIDRLIRACLVIGGVSAACAWTWPGVFPEADPVAVLVRYHTPNFYAAVVAWYYVAPGVAALLAGQFLISTSRIWFARMGVSLGLRSRLPEWPLSPTADGPAIVIGEAHHPVKLAESPTPQWLTIPERGLYTGVAIFGAVGSGKTSACMHPFARQLLSWQAKNPERRDRPRSSLKSKAISATTYAGCSSELDRGGDYIELSLDGRLTWNPLECDVARFVLPRVHRRVVA